MEDVLAVYTRPRDPDRLLVCLDGPSKQLIAETRMPIPMKRGRPARVDYEYERNGTANLFMLFAPLEGWRHVEVTDRHTAIDYAHVLKDLADRHFPHVKTIVLVQDNLNIHSKASLYEAFPACRGPGGWSSASNGTIRPSTAVGLTSPKSELGVLSTQCLDRRIPDRQTLIEEIAAWENDRNAHHTKADWQFATKTARVKLKHLYPSILLNQPTSVECVLRNIDAQYSVNHSQILSSIPSSDGPASIDLVHRICAKTRPKTPSGLNSGAWKSGAGSTARA